MAATFNVSDLSVLSYANGFTLWHYKSAATATATMANSYWPAASIKKLFKNRDIILMDCTDNFVITRVTITDANTKVNLKKLTGA